MNFLPVHSLSITNLFWFPLLYGLISLIIMKKSSKEAKERILKLPNYKTKLNKTTSLLFMLVFGKLIILYSIFIPIKIGTIFFYLGIIIYLIGMVGSTYAMWIFAKADLSSPVTKGIYKYSRHPMQNMYYLSWLGLGLISGTWIIVIYAVVFPLLTIPSLIAQEEDCIAEYGDEYLQYLKETPRFFLFK